MQDVQYSKQQLDDGAAAILAHADDPGWGSFKVDAVSETSSVHDGLTITGSYDQDVAAASMLSLTSLTSLAASILSATMSEGGSAPLGDPLGVQVVLGDAVTPLVDTRWNDSSPFNAGALMVDNDSITKCSSGFAIWYGGDPHTTTARHCNRGPYWSIQGNHKFGSSIAASGQGAAHVLSGAGLYKMFDGAYDNANGYSKYVIGYADLSVGDYVCTSGGMSGVHCNIKVTDLSVWIDDGQGSVQTIKGVQQTSGRIAAAEGDSGGPVLVPYTGGTYVGAAGMIQAGNNKVACTPTAFIVDCFKNVFFSSMRTIVDTLPGASLRTY